MQVKAMPPRATSEQEVWDHILDLDDQNLGLLQVIFL